MAMKPALDKLTLVLAASFAGRGIPIRVNSLQPGAFMTEELSEIDRAMSQVKLIPWESVRSYRVNIWIQAIKVRVGPQGVKAKWPYVELRQVEENPMSGESTFFDYVGPNPVNVWTAPEEWEVLKSSDFPFDIRIPESIPPTLTLEGCGFTDLVAQGRIKYGLIWVSFLASYSDRVVGRLPLCWRQVRQARSLSIALACVQASSSTLSCREPMSIRYYYLRSGLQKKDSFFGNCQQTHTRSASKADPFLANVLLEAERRYGARLAQEGIDKLSIFCGWHRSRKNSRYHYTIQGYNAAGWMAFTVEMEVANQGRVFPYGQTEWNDWLARTGGNPAKLRAKDFFEPVDHVEAGISWEGSTTGVEILSTPSYPTLGPAPNHPADNLVTRGYTIIIQNSFTTEKGDYLPSPDTTIHLYVFKVPASTLVGVLPIMGMHKYAVQHDYTAEQHEWMAHQGALFEGAVQDNHTIGLTLPVAQLKELSTLYIMGLKNQWLVHGMRPEGWSEELVLAKLDYLEDMVVTLWKLQWVFVVERADSTEN
ncbi:hypothetical protein EDD18DRAFT_1103653 [Armillaria luteobubalina]|uniref:Uncharacterized protein n=1 Tax=Armillaria luteobubalina TaxID=153913 RepID=A0AA39QCL3_9AGAR|nr:hypothetical protein EDD18DRAFT_1103653 [Armillaria luteobubalina]